MSESVPNLRPCGICKKSFKWDEEALLLSDNIIVHLDCRSEGAAVSGPNVIDKGPVRSIVENRSYLELI